MHPLDPYAARALDAAMVATVNHVVGGRNASIRQMGVTQRTVSSYIEEFGQMPLVESDRPFPIYRWRLAGHLHGVEVAVIDRGDAKVRILMDLTHRDWVFG